MEAQANIFSPESTSPKRCLPLRITQANHRPQKLKEQPVPGVVLKAFTSNLSTWEARQIDSVSSRPRERDRETERTKNTYKLDQIIQGAYRMYKKNGSMKIRRKSYMRISA